MPSLCNRMKMDFIGYQGIENIIPFLADYRAVMKANFFHKKGYNADCSLSNSMYMMGFGVIQIFLSQLPYFHDLWWLSIVVALMSFAYSLIALASVLLKSSQVAKCGEIGLPQIILLIIFSQYIPQVIHSEKPVVDRFAVLFTVALVWLYAYLLTVGGAYKNVLPKTQLHCRTVKSRLIGGSLWIQVPYPFQWGPPSFDAGEAFAMMIASFVALIEATGKTSAYKM